MKQVVTPSNLGLSIKAAHLAANKFDVNIDSTTIVASVLGVLSANYTNAGFVQAVKDNETETSFDQIGNSYVFTRETGITDTGSFVETVALTVDSIGKTIQVTVNGVESSEVDISALYADINVDTVTWDAPTYVLTLTETDGTVHTLNLAALIAITTADSLTITLTGDGTVGSPLQADAKISAAPGNILEQVLDGLYVPEPDALVETDLSSSDTATIAITLSGDANHTIEADVKVSAVAGNIVSVEADGIYVPAPDAETALSATDSATIDFTTSGTANHGLTASVKISATAGNVLEAKADGLYVPTPEEFTETVLSVTSTDGSVSADLSGVSDHTVDLSVNIDPAGDNLVSSTGNGLYVDPASIVALATEELQDAFGVHLGYMFP